MWLSATVLLSGKSNLQVLRAMQALSPATEPTSRTTPCVNDRYDHNLGLLNAKVDPVRKTPHRCASDVAVNDRISQGMLGEQRNSGESFVEELAS